MKRYVLTSIASAALAVLLAACRVSVGPPVDGVTPDVTTTARSNPDSPVSNVSIPPDETRLIRVSIPSGLRGSGQRLVVEADDQGGFRQLDMVLYQPNGVTPTASTSGTAFFQPGLSGIGEGFIGTALDAAAARRVRAADAPPVERSVSVVGVCFGPCIARPAPSGLTHVYVEIANVGFSTESVPFYAYVEPFIDEDETANDTPAGAADVSPGPGYRGAIEVLGDEDWVRFTEAGFVAFEERPGYDVSLVLELYTGPGTGFVDAIGPGQTIGVLAGEYAVIRSEGAQRASVYGFYDVFYD